jgi:hypothetical protein
MFYYASNPASNQLSTPQDYFNALSLGNIGESRYSCDMVNWAVQKEITLSCPSGTLGEIKYLGVQKVHDVTCINLLQKTKTITEKLEDDCYSEFDKPGKELHTAQGHKEFHKYYHNNCLGKTECTIPLGGVAGTGEMKKQCQTMIEQRWYHSKHVTAADKAKLKTALGAKANSPVGVDGKHVEPWMLAMTQCIQRTVTIDVKQLNKSVEVQK